MKTLDPADNISCSVGLASHITGPSFLFNIPDADVIVGISLSPLIGMWQMQPNALGYAVHIHIRNADKTAKTYSKQELANFVQQAARALDISALTQPDETEIDCIIQVNMEHVQQDDCTIWRALLQITVSPDVVAENAMLLEQQLKAYNAATSATPTTKH